MGTVAIRNLMRHMHATVTPAPPVGPTENNFFFGFRRLARELHPSLFYHDGIARNVDSTNYQSAFL